MTDDVLNERTLRALLQKYDIVPRKHWGQNFLTSRKILDRMLDTSSVQETDTVLEIGGGVGALTDALAQQAGQVVVVERDPSLCEVLRDRFRDASNVEIRCEDARKLDSESLPHDYRIIANLPYSVGLPILRTLIEGERPPRDAYVMLQQEVAERLTAQTPNRTLAGTAMQILAEGDYLFAIPTPTPLEEDVDMIIRLEWLSI